ncbi:MAG: hypothetical protein HY343_00030 [Lentisphaerae bacterium]|nr:hypothetical protein [Lentisphaerota bacterium]
MEEQNDYTVIREILKTDPRYAFEAYVFVREALEFTVKQLNKPAETETRHVSGVELLEGIRQYALQEFGAMAQTVFHNWGVRRCEDFGAIVFNMVNRNILRKRAEDTLDDFSGGYDFTTAFRRPFEPDPQPKTSNTIARQTQE